MVPSDAIRPADDSPLTRMSPLVQIHDVANQDAWSEFMKLYGPIVYGYARKRGLQDADAADLMQDILRSPSLRMDASSAREAAMELHASGKSIE